MPKPRQQERSAATQKRLLDATIACLVERGYAGTSTTAVCERAGLSRGAQLHHYPTKARLVAAAIERLFERRHREFREELRLPLDREQAFARLWAIYAGETLHAWMELLIAARTDARLREQLRDLDGRFFAEAQQTCRHLLGLRDADERHVATLARLVLCVFDGLALHHTLGDREAVTADVLTAFRSLLATDLPGVVNPSPGPR